MKSRGYGNYRITLPVRGTLLILFAKIHFVEIPHVSAKEVPRDGPK